ncbi:amidase [candidate division KSB1 bacterium]|nr:amidase [candidate division KSB1 bacterium]
MTKKVSSKKLAMNRRKFMAYFSSIGLGATLLPGTLVAVAQDADEITVDMVIAAEKIAGLSFPEDMRERFVRDLNRLRTNYQNIRAMKLDASVAPCFVFNPVPPGFEEIEPERNPSITSSVSVTMPNTEEELAFLSVTYLSALIKTRQVTSTDLTKIYLSRLKQYDPKLKCVITLTEKLALEQASKADEEISAGNYKGPLHGIPWGVKDLIAVKGYRTTWGAEPYKNQVIDTDATVYKRLTNAGAVLVAKLTSGGLATGDTWFGGKTRNPWNTEQGSGGSSAGPGSATAAGLVGFSIGTETQGSIISPSSRCGVTGLRPTFGMVSRHGVMPLSWTMDKVGPICRSAEDCAIVLNAIYGPDGYDTAVVNRPFNWHPADDLTKIRVGYVKSSFERESRAQTDEGRRRAGEQRQIDNSAIEVFRSLGIELIPLEFPQSISAGNLGFVLHIEGAAVFDDIVRSGEIDSMSNSNRPYRFRVRRFTPGVEYIQANRVRTILMQDFSKALKDIDVYIGGSTSITNHTGHPAMTIPHGFINGLPTGLRINGNLFKDAEMITVARAFQNATDHHTKHPAL